MLTRLGRCVAVIAACPAGPVTTRRWTDPRQLDTPRTDLTDPWTSARPQEAPNPPSAAGIRVLRRDRLGGVIHEYLQVA